MIRQVISNNVRQMTNQEQEQATPIRRPLIRFSLASLLAVVFVAGVLFQPFEQLLRDYFRDRSMVVPTSFDVASGKNVLWSAKLGSVAWGRPVVSGGKVFVGTNNTAGYLDRYPASTDLGVLLCFDAADGQFLWQASNEKLPAGRVHDWPLQGVTSAATVEADRLWYVSNRGEVVCLDTGTVGCCGNSTVMTKTPNGCAAEGATEAICLHRPRSPAVWFTCP